DEFDGRRVAPLQILEHDHERLLGAGCVDVLDERAADLIRAENRILARGRELRATVIREWSVDELRDELGHACGGCAREVAAHAAPELLLANGLRLADRDGEAAAKRVRDDRERRADPQRIGPAEPDLDRVP